MQFLHQVQRNPRWEPVATLYASNVPNAPTVAAIGPTYPVPIGTEPPTFDEKKDDENSKKSNLPAMLGRPVGAPDRLTSLVSYQDSRISELARAVLSVRHLCTYLVTSAIPIVPRFRRLLFKNGPCGFRILACSNAALNSSSMAMALAQYGIRVLCLPQ